MNADLPRPYTGSLTFSVVLPTYNEKDNITPLMETILRSVPGAEIVVVDDDSPDGTWKVVQDFAEGRSSIQLLRRTDKKGLVSALNDGISLTHGEIVGWLDCDLSMPPELYPEFLRKIEGGFDFVAGSRFVDGGGVEIISGSEDTVSSFMLSLALNKFTQLILGRDFKDYTSGFIALRKEILDKNPLRGDYGEYFIELAYRAKKGGYKLAEIPYLCRARTWGVSKTGTNLFQYFRRGMKYLAVTLKMRFSRLSERRER